LRNEEGFVIKVCLRKGQDRSMNIEPFLSNIGHHNTKPKKNELWKRGLISKESMCQSDFFERWISWWEGKLLFFLHLDFHVKKKIWKMAVKSVYCKTGEGGLHISQIMIFVTFEKGSCFEGKTHRFSKMTFLHTVSLRNYRIIMRWK